MSAGKKAEAPGSLDVTIMGHQYRVTCKPGEERELLDAVAHVDTRMRETRDALRQNNAERIAVMTALNIAHDLLHMRSTAAAAALPRDDLAPQRANAVPSRDAAQRSSESDVDLAGLKRRIQSLQSTLDSTLAEQERLL